MAQVWATRTAAHRRQLPRWPIPLFTNAPASADGTIGAGGLPLPDFTWAGWQGSWCQLSAQLQLSGRRHGLAATRAFFAGGLDNGRDRKELRWLRADADGGVARARASCCGCGTSTRAALMGPVRHRQPHGQRQREAGAAAAERRVRPRRPRSLALGTRRASGSCSRAARWWSTWRARTRSSSCRRSSRPPLGCARGRNAVGAQLPPTLERLRADERTAARIAAAGQRLARRWLSLRRCSRTCAGCSGRTPAPPRRSRADARHRHARDERGRPAQARRALRLLAEGGDGERKLTATEEAQQAAARVCMNAVPEAWRARGRARAATAATPPSAASAMTAATSTSAVATWPTRNRRMIAPCSMGETCKPKKCK